MKRIRLLPLVLIAVSALLAVKVLGFVMGVEPFAVGPHPAIASGAEAAGHGEAAAPAAAGADTSAVDRLTAPVDLAEEYKKLKDAQDKAAAGHGEAPAEGHGGTPAGAPAAGATHEAAPAADASHGAAPADGKPAGEAAPAADATKTAAPADAKPAGSGGNGAAPTDAKPADAGHAAPADAKPADAGGHQAAPAADAAPAQGGHAAPAEGGHGAKAKTDVYTERPKEYSPPIGSSERAILEGLGVRRDELDKRAQDLDLRAKLLQAAEQRLNDRLNQLQSIETQLGGATGGSAPAAPAPAPASTPASKPASAPPTTAAAATPAPAGAAPAMNEQLASLVSLYESMKPKAAAAVFDKLDTATLLELATHMNPRKLSPIIAAMDPEKAGHITGLMVGAQEAQKRVVVQVEQVAPSLGPVSGNGGAAPADNSQLPQIMPAPAGQ
ncbi:MotE family protein [Pleomorphomonas sp. PLEO]|uniref:MotE family protein n=1 Tax=Pleomorphomonas sp. PLEO TaxID=3239306 RepID=UPI00351E1C33